MSELTHEQLEQFRERLLTAKQSIEEALRQSAGERPVERSGSTIGRLSRMDAMQVQAMAEMGRRQLHKSLDDELLRWITFHDVADLHRNFDIWRDRYNFERPHEALGDEPPVSRYQPSARIMPDPLPPIEYASGDHVRKVDAYGCVSFSGRKVRVGKGCAGSPVAFRPTVEDGTWDVFFCHQRIMRFDLSEPPP